MSYSYRAERSKLFTEEGQRLFLKMRDRTKVLINTSGAAMLSNIMSSMTGDSFTMIACMDRMIELGELICLNPDQITQYRVYILK